MLNDSSAAVEMNEATKELQKYLLHADNMFQAGLLQLWGGNGSISFFFFKQSSEKKKKLKAWVMLGKRNKTKPNKSAGKR